MDVETHAYYVERSKILGERQREDAEILQMLETFSAVTLPEARKPLNKMIETMRRRKLV